MWAHSHMALSTEQSWKLYQDLPDSKVSILSLLLMGQRPKLSFEEETA